MCAYAELCGVCICVQKRKRDKTIACFEVCVLTHHSAYAHACVGCACQYICSAETSLSSYKLVNCLRQILEKLFGQRRLIAKESFF